MTKFLLSGFYLFGFVVLSKWSISFGEIFGAGDSAVFQLAGAVLFTFIVGGYTGLPLIYIKFKRSENVVFYESKGLPHHLRIGRAAFLHGLQPSASALPHRDCAVVDHWFFDHWYQRFSSRLASETCEKSVLNGWVFLRLTGS
ncbi:hypothetical protein P9D36_08295 [Bacillus haynesii]|uniref:hypothetical protein n=1 Tax=Bacillus haynesii TaxID=1925021 RepID=UPI00228041D1|nr:hypothetical protein [Bacillus haynesii]MCY7814173.1 hypothetical protein [Bacillus haynesii]MCY8242966.1 hypothetical protein [Bacillus haynesii]MCY8565737.1 hypothetical protein [Bacillus haynesii]MCY8662618.1 hypothetical protein [Bacillus haynesii]MEC1346936.1 hypothetical protein [Bacillus haynesii]